MEANNGNGNAVPFDPLAHFPSLESASEYLAQHGKAEAFAAVQADKGDFILMARSAPKPEAPKSEAKPEGKAKGQRKAKAKAEAKPEAPKPAKGKKGSAARIAAGLAEAAKPKAEAKPKATFDGPWHKLSDRPRWIGKWADLEKAAREGKLPDFMGAKADYREICGGMFAADTHKPFAKRINALAALIRAKDEKGLKALQIKEISTTPNMLGKLRDLAIAAFAARAEKPKRNGKAKVAKPAEAPAPEAPAQG
jgi:hypothetical protein